MTSEVLILNKRAVVLGADSAVTSSGGEHPRYSKTANKIFEISKNGSVAAAIYGSASIDLVPWELALKLYRAQLKNLSFEKLEEYCASLLSFLSGNDLLFPTELRKSWVDSQFDDAVKEIIKEAQRNSPSIYNEEVSLEERREIWRLEAKRLDETFTIRGVQAPLTKEPLDDLLENLQPWVERVQAQLAEVPALAGVDATQVACLGHRLRYCVPDALLGSTGLVIAGYGEQQIFPAYEQIKVFGHIGNELFYKTENSFQVTHTGIAMIQPLAQTSMIDMFTEGFGKSLENIIEEKGKQAFEKIFSELSIRGIQVDPNISAEILNQQHSAFMEAWKRENWKRNFNPLVDVLQTLSIQEMAHLAESLLGLESLKERVTSPSESVGGPIDVAAITKSEGLVWIKRKHYFDASLNMRYATRLSRAQE